MSASAARRSRRPRAREGGFLLLEALVAAAIAAIAFAVLAGIGRDALRLARAGAATEAALSLARSHVALEAAALRESDRAGADGAFRWRAHTAVVARARPPEGVVDRFEAAARARPVLFAIAVEVDWTEDGRTRHVALETNRVGFAPPQTTEDHAAADGTLGR
jgi:hypothetical protein